MKRAAALVLLTALLLVGSARWSPVAGEESFNPMHPLFLVLDDSGQSARKTGRPPSVLKTCGACHDAAYIEGHNSHVGEGRQATCVDCHFAEGRLPADPALYDREGRLLRQALRISAPRDENCALCHGIVHLGKTPLRIPDDFEQRALVGQSNRTYALTRFTGEILSGQNLSDSYLNLEGKARRTYPWDVHSRRLVGCVACHFAANNPTRAEVKHTTLDFLKEDPRRISLAEFLQKPDHRLVTASCRSCHDPLKIHAFLPYRQRHLDVLECTACHIPELMGPAAQSVDASVVNQAGAPVVSYRGVLRGPEGGLSSAFITGYAPLLLPSAGGGGTGKLGPYNLVDHWDWVSSATGRAVPWDLVGRAFLDGGGYLPEVLPGFDADNDGKISSAELSLDSAAKLELIRSRLVRLGIPDPVLRRSVSLHPIHHGVLSGDEVQRDCVRCHAKESRLSAVLPLSSFVPAGANAKMDGPGDQGARFRIRQVAGGTEALGAEPAGGFYVFGHARGGWSDTLGFVLFSLVVAGSLVHAGFRLQAAGVREKTARAMTRVYLYSGYERIWHWLMAVSILGLCCTGLQIHFAGGRGLLPLARAVAVHNFLAAVMMINAFLSLFYHLATSAIRQFLPGRTGLLGRIAEQAHFYARGMFLGQPHPTPKSLERKLNPLQQVTYLVLLNVLFPLQVGTGVLIWGASRWPGPAAAVHGLAWVAPLHNLGSWLFLAFIVLHLYLSTTGHGILSSIKAMLNGYDLTESAPPAGTGVLHGH